MGKLTDQRSAEAAAWRKLYESPRWRGKHGARLAQLRKQPLCERCLAKGKITPATVVNHRQPHKGDIRLFFDPENHESTCKPHHDSAIQSEERRGHARGSTIEGRPLDQFHPWNR